MLVINEVLLHSSRSLHNPCLSNVFNILCFLYRFVKNYQLLTLCSQHRWNKLPLWIMLLTIYLFVLEIEYLYAKKIYHELIWHRFFALGGRLLFDKEYGLFLNCEVNIDSHHSFSSLRNVYRDMTKMLISLWIPF